jgi:cytochrome P450
MTQTIERRIPRGPAARGPMGDLPAYNADPLNYMRETARQYGEFVPLRFAFVRALMLTSPAAIEAVHVKENRHFVKARGLRALGTILGNGLVISEGDFWLRQRRLMQPAFHRSSVERYGAIMERRTREMLDSWQVGRSVDAVVEMRRLTFRIAAESLFGADVSEDELAEAGAALETVETHLQTRVSSLKMFLPDWLPTPGNLRTRAAVRRIDELVHSMIEGRRADPAQHQDLLALLLRARDEAGGMTDRQLRDEVVTLLIAGHETTAFTLAWALHLVALHPQTDAALRAELASVLDGRQPSVADIPRLPVTESVVYEALRLYPAGYISGRDAVSDVEIEGYLVRKGTVVILPQWAMHRDPRFFDDPDAFRPERWSDGLAKRLPRGVFFPFGMGARQCIGAPFAMQESVLVLAAVLQRFRLEPAWEGEVRAVPKVALQPDRPIRLRLAGA